MYSKEQKVNEVARVIDVLKEDKKKISKKSILSLANKDMIDDNFIASVDWDFLLSHVDDSTPSKYLVNSKKRTDVCFEAFKNVLDKMIEDGIEISPQTIIKNNTGKSFSRTYYLHGAAIEHSFPTRRSSDLSIKKETLKFGLANLKLGQMLSNLYMQRT